MAYGSPTTHVQHVSVILSRGDLVRLHVIQGMEFTLPKNPGRLNNLLAPRRSEADLRQPRSAHRYTRLSVNHEDDERRFQTYPDRKVIRYLLRKARSCNRLMRSFLSDLCPFAHQWSLRSSKSSGLLSNWHQANPTISSSSYHVFELTVPCWRNHRG